MTDQKLKGPWFMILVAALVLFFAMNIGLYANLRKQVKTKDQEIAKRLDAEEAIIGTQKQVENLKNKLGVKENELQQEKDSHNATKARLEEQKAAVSSLKDELDKVTKIKEALEEELRDLLASTMGQDDKARKTKR